MAEQSEVQWMRDWLSAVQITQDMESAGDGFGDGFDFDLHQRSGYHYDDYGDTYSVSNSQCSALSTSSSESDNDEALFARYNISGERYVSRRDHYAVSHRPDASGDAKPAREQLPEWFNNQPFQHHSKILLASIPGLLLVISLGGDMFLGLLTLGCLAVYLFQASGSQNRAIKCYIITCVMLQLTILYSVLPLLWKSWVNLILIVAILVFTALVGAYVLLLFDEFRQREVKLTLNIELLLVTVHPAVSTILVTFLVSSVTSVRATPYCFLFSGYLILQGFLQPMTSSFRKPVAGHPEKSLILQPEQLGACALVYASSAPVLFIMCSWEAQDVFSVATLVELLFITSLNILLASAFDINQLFEVCEISTRHKQRVMLACSGVVMAASPAVLRRHGIDSPLLPFLPVALLLHAALVYGLRNKSDKRLIYGCCLTLFVFYVIIISLLPWHHDCLVTSAVPVYVLCSLLLCAVFLSLFCVYTFLAKSEQAFGLTVLCQAVVVSVTLKCLEVALSLNFVVSFGFAVTAVAVIFSLYSSNKIPRLHSLLTISLYVTSALTNLPNHSESDAAGDDVTTGARGLLLAAAEFAALLLMQCVFCRVLLFHQPTLVVNRNAFVRSVCEMAVVIALNCPLWLRRLLHDVTREEPGLSDYICLVLLLECVVACKLSYGSECDWPRAKLVGPACFLLVLLVSVIEPQLTLSWENFLRWLLLLSVIACLVTISLVTSHTRLALSRLLALSLLSGVPLGFSLSAVVFPTVPLAVHGVIAILTSALFTVVLLVWLESRDMEHNVINSVLTLAVLFILVSVSCAAFQGYDTEGFSCTQPVVVSLCTTSLVLAVVFKLHSLRRQSLQLTKDGMIHISKLPLLGNTCTLVAMMTFCFVSPWQRDLSLYLSTVFLLLLQRDHTFLRSHSKENNLTPTLIALYILITIAASYHSNYWTEAHWWLKFLGLVEQVLCIATLPHIYVLTTVLWEQRFYISDRTVVFLTPLYVVLILVGSSYTSWILSAVGILSGWWLMSAKLPLDR